MVVPRKWKLVAGAMSATVALGASAAVAEEGSSKDETDKRVLAEVIDVSQLPQAADLTDAVLLQVEPDDGAETPFDSISAADDSIESSESVDSQSLDSESVDSVASEDSVDSGASEDSVESVASEESVSND